MTLQYYVSPTTPRGGGPKNPGVAFSVAGVTPELCRSCIARIFKVSTGAESRGQGRSCGRGCSEHAAMRPQNLEMRFLAVFLAMRVNILHTVWCGMLLWLLGGLFQSGRA